MGIGRGVQVGGTAGETRDQIGDLLHRGPARLPCCRCFLGDRSGQLVENVCRDHFPHQGIVEFLLFGGRIKVCIKLLVPGLCLGDQFFDTALAELPDVIANMEFSVGRETERFFHSGDFFSADGSAVCLV